MIADTISTEMGEFNVRVLQDTRSLGAEVSVIIVNSLTSRMTINAIKSFNRFSDVPTNYIVVDNFSSDEILADLCRELPFATIVSNHGTPKTILHGYWDSQLNAVGVDLGTRFVTTPLAFVCHNDVIACGKGWLRHLISKLTPECRGASFFHDTGRIGAMHVCGYLYDTAIYGTNEAKWYPTADRSRDVGDHYTKHLRDAGLSYHVCDNTHNNTDLHLPTTAPTAAYEASSGVPVTSIVAVDDDGRSLYIHLGRGSLKSVNAYSKSGKTTHEQWVAFGDWVNSTWQD
jgi:hypothetical protein